MHVVVSPCVRAPAGYCVRLSCAPPPPSPACSAQILHAVPDSHDGQPILHDSPLYEACTITLALFAGLLQATMGFFRVGAFMSFVAEPVIAGFTSAAAILIACSQVQAACPGPPSHPLAHAPAPCPLPCEAAAGGCGEGPGVG
jgi:MFS superfamily sulfate permease-like transporter